MKYPYPLQITGLFNGKVGIDKDSDIFSKKIPDKIKIELETSHISLHITGKIQLEAYTNSDKQTIRYTQIFSTEDSINQQQRRNDYADTIDMYNNDRDTTHS